MAQLNEGQAVVVQPHRWELLGFRGPSNDRHSSCLSLAPVDWQAHVGRVTALCAARKIINRIYSD